MDGTDDWDLHAVVRSCSTSSTTTTDGGALPSTSAGAVAFSELRFQNPTDERRSDELRDFGVSNWGDLPRILLPFSQHNMLISHEMDKQSSPQQNPAAPSRSEEVKRYKKRKSVTTKQICRVDAKNLPSDVWCWRKYGQKPIKGSPFPRSYYRCSSSKLCTARKQVERDKSNPEIFLVTYTAEHNHPAPSNRSLPSGATRQKPTEEVEKTEVKEKLLVDGDTNNGDFSFSNMAMDDFFVGMGGLVPGEDEGCSWDSEPTYPVNSSAGGATNSGRD